MKEEHRRICACRLINRSACRLPVVDECIWKLQLLMALCIPEPHHASSVVLSVTCVFARAAVCTNGLTCRICILASGTHLTSFHLTIDIIIPTKQAKSRDLALGAIPAIFPIHRSGKRYCSSCFPTLVKIAIFCPFTTRWNVHLVWWALMV
jgi:hypothetical protein